MVAKPFVFAGEQDVLLDQVWDVDLPMGERALWQRLFQLIHEAL